MKWRTRKRTKRWLALLLCLCMALPSTANVALAADDPVPQADNEAAITALTLKDFTPHGETVSRDLNLLENTDPIQWDIFNSYTLEIGVSLPTGSEGNTMTLTLPEGMKFVNLNTDNIAANDGVESADWEKGAEIYGYQPDNGTLKVTFGSGVEGITLSVSLQPDDAFFPYEKKDVGFSIENGIQVTLNEGGNLNSQKKIDVEVQVNETNVSTVDARIGDVGTGLYNVETGSTVYLTGNVWLGWLNYKLVTTERLIEEVTLILSVPDELTLAADSSSGWKLTRGVKDLDNEDNTLWQLTMSKSSLSRSCSLTSIFVTVPEETKEATSYTLKGKSISVKTYGQKEAYDVDNQTENWNSWTINIVAPDQIMLKITNGDAVNVYDYTKELANNGTAFIDYNTSFSGSVIKNAGTKEIKVPLIYKAVFDQGVQFVTAAGIPCGWDDKENTWLPTKIVITDEDGGVYTMTDPALIRESASQAYQDYGFVLRADQIPDYDTSKSIQSVIAELPGLPEGYSSADYPLSEMAGINHCYSGVWGRVRENRGENKTGTNRFTIYQKDGDKEILLAEAVSKTTIAAEGRITGMAPTGTLTVNGSNKKEIMAGEVLHVRQKIQASPSHGGFHYGETILYDPVVYLLEPEDFDIENVSFIVASDDGSTSGKIPYTRTDLTGSVPNLPDGYRLYQYTFNEKIMSGWWDGDWNASELYTEFDYRIDSAARTHTYDLQELILYKSSLELPFSIVSRNDSYNLNGGKDLGGVGSNVFTVQAVSTFHVTSAIQIEGEDKWYAYNPDDPANTTAVFKEGDTANVRVTIANNSGADAKSVEVYIPVPKKGQDFWGEHFIQQTGFDMSAAGIEGSLPEGWSIAYGKAEEITTNDQDVPTGIVLDGDWEESYSEETNVIRLTLTGSLENGGQAQMVLKFKAAADASQTDSRNIFKSWWKYTANTTSMVDTSKVYNFGALLQNGVLEGTVYNDANRNGKKDTGETGVENVFVQVTDSDGRAYTDYTDTNGRYSFNSLPGDRAMTVTITNPKSPDPADAGGSYRFSPTVETSGGTAGSDVTAASDHRTASKSGIQLGGSGGKASVNAGLIEPYAITFAAAEGRGTVTPATARAYGGQTLGEVLRQAPSVTPNEGWQFAQQWQHGAKTVANTQLLSETVTADAAYTAKFSSVEKIRVVPANIVIYMGGKPYEGAVDGDGNLISDENAGLPEPGFTVQLPETMKDKAVTDLTFREKGGDRTWTFEPYDGQKDTQVYKLIPAKGQEATRVQFTDPDTGAVIPSDAFTVGLEVNKTFEMELYKGDGDSQVGEIVVEADGAEYPVDSLAKGTLTVRGTTAEVQTVAVSADAPQTGVGAVAQKDTVYTINDSKVLVTDRSGVSLLFDGIINNEENDRTSQLKERAEVFFREQGDLPTDTTLVNCEFKYLDLVDANNGNTWVKADRNVTIYWPLPEGAAPDSVQILHFKDLHRDMQTGQIETEIADCEVEAVSAVIRDDYVTFEVGSAGFSPFALVWEEQPQSDDPDSGQDFGKTSGSDQREPVQTGDSVHLILWCAVLAASGAVLVLTLIGKGRNRQRKKRRR